MVILWIAILGLAFGSFLNVLIDRLPNDKSLGGRSHCDHCKRELRAVDLVPVLSFVWLRGKSACCKKPLSIVYPLVEILTAFCFVFAWVSFYHYSALVAVVMMIVLAALIVIFFADLKYRIIPDVMTVVLILCAVALSYLQGNIIGNLIAGAVLFLIMFGIFFITKGRGMGFGDVKLAFAMGLLLGFLAGFGALYIAFILGGLYGVSLILLKKKKLKSKIAFGPFMVIGIVVMLFYGAVILECAGRFF